MLDHTFKEYEYFVSEDFDGLESFSFELFTTAGSNLDVQDFSCFEDSP